MELCKTLEIETGQDREIWKIQLYIHLKYLYAIIEHGMSLTTKLLILYIVLLI